MKTLVLIFLIVILLLTVSIPIWLAIRVKRHPEKDRGMRGVMAEQRGAEYEKGMQKFFMLSYLSTIPCFMMAVVFEDVFGMEKFLSLLIPSFAFGLLLNIAKWRFTGEFSKAGLVTFAIGLVLMVIYLVLK